MARQRKHGYALSCTQQENAMLREELIFVGTCDKRACRGKAFPAAAIDARRRKGIGWTHSNLMQTAFGPILDTPFGTAGDLMIVPDASAEVRVDFADGSAPEHFILGDTATPTARRGNAVRASSSAARSPRWMPHRVCALSRRSSRSASTPATSTEIGDAYSLNGSAAWAPSARASSPRCAPPAWHRTRFLPSTARGSSR